MSKCWYCNNELTTGDNPKHFGICNKCYDEMFKSSDTIIRSFTNKISDLEAKLAEKDAERELDNSFWKQECDSLQKALAEKDAELWKWSTQYARAYVVRQNDLIAEKVGLQQQLAEKDEEIEEVKNELKAKNQRIAELEEQLKNATKQVRNEVCEEIRSRFLATCQIEKGCDTASFSLEVLNRILDQT